MTPHPPPDIHHIAVIGAGAMGAGIAQTAAAAGRNVTMIDVDDAAVARGTQTIARSLDRIVAKGTLPADDAAAVRARVTGTTNFAAVAPADLVIEAAFEDEAVKRDLFRRLDAACHPGAILASNTSSISITLLAAATQRPESVIGMHFFNPVPVMSLVEIVRGARTSDATFATTDALARALGKTPVAVHDYPGFVSNRILMPMLNEAVVCLMEGVAERDAIDTVMKLGMAHPMGPLQLADFIGLDVCLSIMEVLHHGLGDDKYRPCPLLRQMVAAGKLGRKSGEGFYTYAR
ncbi:MAG: 3-hydroxybutyryl-CoA dehydrogenase [Thermomicrobia bacterium]|nr:3-hydroxybutyryl-CoA dehydrogenase [Thermomicrobia bacterium]